VFVLNDTLLILSIAPFAISRILMLSVPVVRFRIFALRELIVLLLSNTVLACTRYEPNELRVFVLRDKLLMLSIAPFAISRTLMLSVPVVRFLIFALRELIVLLLNNTVLACTRYELTELRVFVLMDILLTLSRDALDKSMEAITSESVVRFRIFALRELMVLVLNLAVLTFVMNPFTELMVFELNRVVLTFIVFVIKELRFVVLIAIVLIDCDANVVMVMVEPMNVET